MEHRLCLTTVTGLFAIVSTLSLREERGLETKSERKTKEGYDDSAYLAGFVLRDLMLSVLLAIFALAIGAASLWYVHLRRTDRQPFYSSSNVEICMSILHALDIFSRLCRRLHKRLQYFSDDNFADGIL